jgi:hypothetical protein
LEKTPMATWTDFETDAPEMAADGHRLIYAPGHGEALLATVRGDAPPRIHPITVGIVDGHLYAFLLASAKRIDLERDGRYALHAHQNPTAPDEFSVRGRARLVDDRGVRDAVAGGWDFDADESYHLFEFSIDSAILGKRGPDDWPPRYTTWPARVPSEGR